MLIAGFGWSAVVCRWVLVEAEGSLSAPRGCERWGFDIRGMGGRPQGRGRARRGAPPRRVRRDVLRAIGATLFESSCERCRGDWGTVGESLVVSVLGNSFRSENFEGLLALDHCRDEQSLEAPQLVLVCVGALVSVTANARGDL